MFYGFNVSSKFTCMKKKTKKKKEQKVKLVLMSLYLSDLSGCNKEEILDKDGPN